MLDPRNRPALIVAMVLGLVAFVLLWLWAGWSPLLAWLVGWSVPAFALYGIDKRQARSGGWRIPENLLHGVALIGGVAGAWTGRLVFRHKTHMLREDRLVIRNGWCPGIPPSPGLCGAIPRSGGMSPGTHRQRGTRIVRMRHR